MTLVMCTFIFVLLPFGFDDGRQAGNDGDTQIILVIVLVWPIILVLWVSAQMILVIMLIFMVCLTTCVGVGQHIHVSDSKLRNC